MAAGHIVEERDLQKSAAELLQVELIPGTQVMKDVGDVHFAHARKLNSVPCLRQLLTVYPSVLDGGIV